MSDTVASELTTLQANVAQLTTVDQSAEALIQGIPALIAAAVAQAQAAGATPEQLAAFADLNKQIADNSTALAAAVSANTPAP